MRKIVLLLLLCSLCLPSPTALGAEAMPTPLYQGVAAQNTSVRAEMSREAEVLHQLREGDKAYVLRYEPGWLEVVYGTEDNWGTGYVLRHTIFDVAAIDDTAPLPYGATPAVYSAELVKDTGLYAGPDKNSQHIRALEKGMKLAILGIEDGWAKVIYWRQYGYIYLDAIDSLTPVYDADAAAPGDTVGAFISFFNLSERGLNPNRILNIQKACEFISIELEPGQSFSFNEVAGPYRKTRGYLEAPSFVAGETVPSYGGGTCQVSSTLYNTLLPLTGGITILYRVAHGASGATYLPHGVDAACGNVTIDLKFRNDYAFPVQIEARAHNGVLYIGLIRAA